MKITKDTVFTLTDQEKYLILENTNYMNTEYYLGIRLNSLGNPMWDSQEILYVENELELDPDLEIYLEIGKQKVSFVDKNSVKEDLLRMLFKEQMKMEGRKHWEDQ